MKTICFKIEPELYDKIEAQRGDKSRSDFIRDTLILQFSQKGNTGITGYNEVLRTENDKLKSEMQRLESVYNVQVERIKDLQTQIGFLQLEYQKISNRLLLEEPKKPWYKFWKKGIP